jgi:hypothetical protein
MLHLSADVDALGPISFDNYKKFKSIMLTSFHNKNHSIESFHLYLNQNPIISFIILLPTCSISQLLPDPSLPITVPRV